MRFDTPIKLLTLQKEEAYDPDTGQMTRTPIAEHVRLASIHELSTEEKEKYSGKLDITALEIQIRGKGVHADKIQILRGPFLGTYRTISATRRKNRTYWNAEKETARYD